MEPTSGYKLMLKERERKFFESINYGKEREMSPRHMSELEDDGFITAVPELLPDAPPPSMKDLAVLFMGSRAGAVEGSNGSDYTFKTVLTLMDFGLTPDEFWDMLEQWNKKCIPPWDLQDLKKIGCHLNNQSVIN